MNQAKTGDRVRAHYTGKTEDGTVFDTSRGKEPIEFTIGEGQLIPGFENAVVGMKQGDAKEVTIPPDEAYGHRDDKLMVKVKRELVDEKIDLTTGQIVEIRQPDGQRIPATIQEVTDETVILDANHPLAGETLTFELELEEIK